MKSDLPVCTDVKIDESTDPLDTSISLPVHSEKGDLLVCQMELWKLLYRYLPVGILVASMQEEAQIKMINPLALEMLGYTREQYRTELADEITGFMSKEVLADIIKKLKERSHAEQRIHLKHNARRREGTPILLFCTVMIVTDTKGQELMLFTLQNFAEQQMLINGELSRLERIMRSISGGLLVCRWDEALPILYANEGFLALSGYSREETFRMHDYEAFMEPEEYQRLREDVLCQLKHRDDFSVEYQMRKKDGSTVWILGKGGLSHGDEGKLVVQHLLTDITIQKENALQLQKNLALHTLANNAQAAVFICKMDDLLTVVDCNEAFFDRVGLTKREFSEELKGAFSLLVYPEDAEDLRACLAAALADTRAISNTGRLIRKNGEICWVSISGTVSENSAGELEFHGVLTDITLRRQQEEALRLSNKRLEVALRVSDVAMFDYNIITKQMILQQMDCEKFSMPSVLENAVEVFIGEGIIHPASVQDFRELYEKMEAGAPSASATLYVNDPELGERVYEVTLAAVFDRNGHPAMAIGARKDVTEMRLLQKEKEFGSVMSANQQLIYEANITQNTVLSYSLDWAREFGIVDVSSFSALVEGLCQCGIAENYQKLFRKNLSVEYIAAVLESGQPLISIECHRVDAKGEYQWYQKNINIVKNKMTEDVSIRCYLSDITELKLKEARAEREKQLYATMLSRAGIVYEVNISKNKFVSGHETWSALFGIQKTDNYADMLQEFSLKAVHPEDRKNFITGSSREEILLSYKKGDREWVCEYRRPNAVGTFLWMRCTFHLFEDPQTEDVKGHAYVEDIDEEKNREFELIYKSEHDLLTGFYNKAAAEKYISDFISTSDGKVGKHAFFMMDTDYFKSINDHFGHAFGDAVLEQVTQKVKELFREVDILGRVGGDEFVILMKNIQNRKAAFVKAKEICSNVVDRFVQGDVIYKISASIGIAFYPEHGVTYDDLYRRADTALYASKDNGRNQYTEYNEEMLAMISASNDIAYRKYEQVKTFDENVVEYVFKLLYDSYDKNAAINLVLRLIGKHYDVARVYIFEVSSDEEDLVSTFEWFNGEVKPRMSRGNNRFVGKDHLCRKNFNEEGLYFLSDVKKAEPTMRKDLEELKVKSMLRFSIVKNGKFKGFVGFDECEYLRIPTRKEIADLKVISNVLGIFLLEMRATQEAISAKNNFLAMINGLDSIACVCEPETHKLLFFNEKAKAVTPEIQVGSFCYETIWARREPCDHCRIKQLFAQEQQKISWESYHEASDRWILFTASKIEWTGKRQLCLINGMDITDYKTKEH